MDNNNYYVVITYGPESACPICVLESEEKAIQVCIGLNKETLGDSFGEIVAMAKGINEVFFSFCFEYGGFSYIEMENLSEKSIDEIVNSIKDYF